MNKTFSWQIKFDPSLPTPVWSQIVSEISRNISRFRPDPGTPVISERQLAETLKLHRNTVRQAYAELLEKQIFAYRNCRSIVIGPEAKQLFRKPFPMISLIMHQKATELFKEFTKQSFEIFGSLLDHASLLGISTNIVVQPPINASKEEINFWIEKNLMRSIGIINFGPRTYRNIDPVFEELSHLSGIPQVLVQGNTKDNLVSSVVDDCIPGFRKMLSALRDHGHRKLAICDWKFASHMFYSSAAKRGSVLYALAPEYGITPEVISIESFHSEKDQLSRELSCKLDMLFSRHSPPRAIWSQNDYTGMFIYDCLKRKGFSIPEDVSLIGYDNDTDGLLASVSYSRTDLGKELVEVIWNIYNNGKPNTVIHRGIPAEFYPNKTIGECKK